MLQDRQIERMENFKGGRLAASELRSPFSDRGRVGNRNAVESTPVNYNQYESNADDVLGVESHATSRKIRNLSMLSPSSNA